MTDINALRATLAKATQGEWRAYPTLCGEYAVDSVEGEYATLGFASVGDNGSGEDGYHDAAAIVALHNAAPALLDELEALRAAARDTAGLVSEVDELRRQIEIGGKMMDLASRAAIRNGVLGEVAEAALALWCALKEQPMQPVAVQIDGPANWTITRPRSPAAMEAALATVEPVDRDKAALVEALRDMVALFSADDCPTARAPIPHGAALRAARAALNAHGAA